MMDQQFLWIWQGQSSTTFDNETWLLHTPAVITMHRQQRTATLLLDCRDRSDLAHV